MSPTTKPKNEFNFYPLRGEGLAQLEAYSAEVKAFHAACRAVHKKAADDIKAVSEEYSEILKKRWIAVTALAGLDADATWDNPEYSAEVNYITEGFGAIVYHPSPESMVAGLLEDEQEEALAVVVPDGAVIN